MKKANQEKKEAKMKNFTKCFGIIALSVVIGLIAACENNTTSSGGSDGGNGVFNSRLTAFLGRDADGISYDLVIDEPGTASSARNVLSVGTSYRLVVTEPGNTPKVSEGMSAGDTGNMTLTSGESDDTVNVTTNNGQMNKISGRIRFKDGSHKDVNKDLTPYNVYIGGFSSAGRPCYWNGKTRIDLPVPADTIYAIVTHIKIVNGVVYAAGFYNNNGPSNYCYWVNDVRTDLFNYGEENAGVEGFTVDDKGNVYVISQDSIFVNGIKSSIQSYLGDDDISSIKKIEAYGDDIYILGYISFPQLSYWKNKTKIADLSDNGTLHIPLDFTVDSTGNVYVLSITGASTYYWQFWCWKNGTEKTELPIGVNGTGNAKAMKVDSKGDVYVVGYLSYGYVNGYAIWKNGVPNLDIFKTGGELLAATASGGNIYAVASEPQSLPGYYINGELVTLEKIKGGQTSVLYVSD